MGFESDGSEDKVCKSPRVEYFSFQLNVLLHVEATEDKSSSWNNIDINSTFGQVRVGSGAVVASNCLFTNQATNI